MSKLYEIELKEARLRARLKRQGYRLQKSRFRNPELRATYSGYMIIDNNNRIAAGVYPREFSLTLEEAENFLQESTD